MSSDVPRVSIVMSVYNEARRVSRAIASLQAQTFTDWELILINDGSTDETGRVLDDAAQNDRRLRVVHQENQGLTRALIDGCRLARGEYIARHDADDWSESARLAVQVAQLDADPALGFVACATQYVGPRDEPLELLAPDAPSAEATRRLLDERQGPPAHGSVMFRRGLYEAVGGYRGEFYFGQDSDLWMRMAERMPIACETRRLYNARRDPDSVSGRMGGLQHEFGELGQACRAARRDGRSEDEYLAAARRLTAVARKRRQLKGSRHRRATMAYLIGTSLGRLGDPRARDYYWQAIGHHPLYWRAWMRLALSTMRPRASTTGPRAT
jgi:glycosyltransferase involved in cell wall biosynthesis